MTASRRTSPLRLRAWLELVARQLGTTHDELVGRVRTRHVVEARQVAMYILRRETGMSFPEIGNLFGRDHSTVVHAAQGVEERMRNRPVFRRYVEAAILTAPPPVAGVRRDDAPPPLFDEDKDRLLTLHNDFIRKVAVDLGVKPRVVRAWIRQARAARRARLAPAAKEIGDGR